MGPKEPRSTVLTPEEEAIVVAFRRHTLLPLDDCLYALQPTIPHLRRSSLHRCFQRHDIARLPETEGDKPRRSRFKAYPIGFFHIDIAEVHTEEGRLYLFVAIDRTSKYAFVQLHQKATRRIAADFLRALVEAVPYKIHTVLTDNGTQFVENTPINSEAETKVEAYWAERNETRIYLVHAFAHACEQNSIDHRLKKPRHPWTNGQVERMNRTIKDATVRRYYYNTHDDLRHHLQLFVEAYNYGRRLKTLRGSRHTNSSAKPGQSSLLGSGSIRYITLRDRTSNRRPPARPGRGDHQHRADGAALRRDPEYWRARLGPYRAAASVRAGMRRPGATSRRAAGNLPSPGAAGVPILVVTAEASACAAANPPTVDFPNAAGGSAELLHLPDHGVHGNGHGLIFEKNSDEVLRPVLEWLGRRAKKTDAAMKPDEDR